MLSLIKKRKHGSSVIPSSLTTLSVSWLNNQFKAVAVHRGTVVGTWERPGDTDGPDRFDAFVREAGQHTGYKGQSVSLVLAHPRLVQQLIDVPPIKGQALHKVIHRQAQQQKMFTGEAAWASQMSPAGKTAQRVILHLFPKLLLNQFIQGCKRNGLHLTSVLPASAVLQNQLPQLPLLADEVGLVAAETGGSTTLLAGGPDGQILLARTLTDTWNEETERLALDLNRTVLFINQQYSVTINKGLWLFGHGAEQKTAAVQKFVPLPVDESPVEYEPFYWATESLKLRSYLTPNFITRELRQAPQRRVFATVVGALTLMVVCASLFSSAWFLRQSVQEAAGIQTLTRDTERLEATKVELQALDRELSRKRQVVQLIIGDRPPPIPAWFLAYLGDAVPSDLVVTNLQIARQDDYYKVMISGTFQQAAKQPLASQITDPVAVLKTRLAGAPFHLKITETEAEKAAAAAIAPSPSGPQTGVPAWLSRITSAVSSRAAANKPVRQDHFVIEGALR